jgi:multidrug efflux system membrane fusion protein
MNLRIAPAFPSVPVLLLMALAVAGCVAGEANNAPAVPPAPEVTTAEVAVRDVREWADFTGRLEAVESVEVRARVGGYVESVHFAEGSRVDQGDLLFQIDPRPFQAEVDRLVAERGRMEAKLELARSYRDRAERLLARNATSQEELEQFVADAAVAEAELAAVQASLEAAELNLSFTRVTAPITGRVSRAVVTAGNLVDSSTLLTTLVSDDPVHVYFDIDEHTYLEHVQHTGDADAAAYVGLINETGYPHAARLDFVDNQVDPDHGTIRARAVLDNPDGRFTPGLFARLKLVSPKRYRAALVDDRAIGSDLDRKFVFVIDEQNIVQYRAVETGRVVDGLRVVTSGLSSGEVVIVNGLQRVRPGVTVDATKVAMDRDSSFARVAAFEDVERAVHNVR